ncbi:unnamed protein product [Pedinophyceae sp. YPF-701]|nr:unnamed protein product [Pedinophyceae sp. YPF-701]
MLGGRAPGTFARAPPSNWGPVGALGEGPFRRLPKWVYGVLAIVGIAVARWVFFAGPPPPGGNAPIPAYDGAPGSDEAFHGQASVRRAASTFKWAREAPRMDPARIRKAKAPKDGSGHLTVGSMEKPDEGLLKGFYERPECMHWAQSAAFVGGGSRSHITTAEGRVVTSHVDARSGRTSVYVYAMDPNVAAWTESQLEDVQILRGHGTPRWHRWGESMAAGGNRLAVTSRISWCRDLPGAEGDDAERAKAPSTCFIESRVVLFEWQEKRNEYVLLAVSENLAEQGEDEDQSDSVAQDGGPIDSKGAVQVRLSEEGMITVQDGNIKLWEWPKAGSAPEVTEEVLHDDTHEVIDADLHRDVLVVVLKLSKLSDLCEQYRVHESEEQPKSWGVIGGRPKIQPQWCSSYVQVYLKDGDKWRPNQVLLPKTRDYGGNLHAAIGDGLIAVGEPEGDAGTFTDSGRVVVWARGRGMSYRKWLVQAVVSADANSAHGSGSMDGFGQDVAIQGSQTLVVGAQDLYGQGIVYAFELDRSGGWQETANFVSTPQALLSTEDISLSGDRLLVRCDWPAARVFVFDAVRDNCPPLPETTTPPAAEARAGADSRQGAR